MNIVTVAIIDGNLWRVSGDKLATVKVPRDHSKVGKGIRDAVAQFCEWNKIPFTQRHVTIRFKDAGTIELAKVVLDTPIYTKPINKPAKQTGFAMALQKAGIK